MTRLLARACALGILTVSTVRAQVDARPRSGIVVHVAAVGPAAVTTSMAERVRAAGSRLNVSTRWRVRARIDPGEVLAGRDIEAGVLARVWLDLSNPRRAVLYVANATHDRFLVRVVPSTDGYGELTQESLTTIVESVIDSLIAGGQIGVDREEATRTIEEVGGAPLAPAAPAVPAPAAQPTEPGPPLRDPGPTTAPLSNPWSAVDLSYRVDAVSSGPSLRHGPQASLSFTHPLSPSLDALFWFGGHYAPSSALGDGHEVTVHGAGLRAAAGLTGRFTPALSWRAALGAGADALSVQSRIPPESGLVRAEDFVIAVPVATTFLGASLRLGRWVSLPIAAGLDVDLSGHHFDAQLEAERAPLVRPWVAHPFVTVGVGVPLTR